MSGPGVTDQGMGVQGMGDQGMGGPGTRAAGLAGAAAAGANVAALDGQPGEVLVADGEIAINTGRATVTLVVANSGDRPIQVGSHYHFAETNPALEFDRAAARGFRLDIAAGTAVRFEPGQVRTVHLVAYAGARRVVGFRGEVMGALEDPQ